MPIQRILLIRHGETDYNAEGRMQGQLDVPLNANGVQQAERTAAYVHDCYPLDAIYSSDLSRAADTAGAIARRMGLIVQHDERLREIHLGVFQGYTSAELAVRYPESYAAWRADRDHYVVPGGESFVQCHARGVAAFYEIIARHPGRTIAIVSHGGVVRGVLRALFPALEIRDGIHNAAIQLIEHADEQFHLALFNHQPHA